MSWSLLFLIIDISSLFSASFGVTFRFTFSGSNKADYFYTTFTISLFVCLFFFNRGLLGIRVSSAENGRMRVKPMLSRTLTLPTRKIRRITLFIPAEKRTWNHLIAEHKLLSRISPNRFCQISTFGCRGAHKQTEDWNRTWKSRKLYERERPCWIGHARAYKSF